MQLDINKEHKKQTIDYLFNKASELQEKVNSMWTDEDMIEFANWATEIMIARGNYDFSILNSNLEIYKSLLQEFKELKK